MRKHWSLIQALLFYVIWYVAVLAVAQPHQEVYALLVQASFILISLAFVKQPLPKEIKFLLALVIIGTLFDSIPAFFDLIEFPQTKIYLGVYPLWMSAMWACFAVIFSSGLSWMLNRLFFQILFGAIGGTLSLYAASSIGAVYFPADLRITMFFYALEWGIVVPLACTIYKRIMQPRDLMSKINN